MLCLLHGATFLGLKSGGVVRDRSQELARRLSWPALLLVAVYAVWTVSIARGGPNLTAASGDYSLKVMTVVAAVMFPVVLLYQGWSYWVFRARLNAPAETSGERSSTGQP